MKLPSLLFVIIACLAVTAHAQLDQPQASTDALLGKPISTHPYPADNLVVANYRTQNYDVTAGFKNGVTSYLVYKKKIGGTWTDDEIANVLNGHTIGHDNWHWNKDIITGRHGPAVHKGASKNINEPEVWHIFAHKQYTASYFPEKGSLVIWDTANAETPEGILSRSAL